MVLSTLPHYESVAMPELLAGLTGRTGKVTLGYRVKTAENVKPRRQGSRGL